MKASGKESPCPRLPGLLTARPDAVHKAVPTPRQPVLGGLACPERQECRDNAGGTTQSLWALISPSPFQPPPPPGWASLPWPQCPWRSSRSVRARAGPSIPRGSGLRPAAPPHQLLCRAQAPQRQAAGGRRGAELPRWLAGRSFLNWGLFSSAESNKAVQKAPVPGPGLTVPTS